METRLILPEPIVMLIDWLRGLPDTVPEAETLDPRSVPRKLVPDARPKTLPLNPWLLSTMLPRMEEPCSLRLLEMLKRKLVEAQRRLWLSEVPPPDAVPLQRTFSVPPPSSVMVPLPDQEPASPLNEGESASAPPSPAGTRSADTIASKANKLRQRLMNSTPCWPDPGTEHYPLTGLA